MRVDAIAGALLTHGGRNFSSASKVAADSPYSPPSIRRDRRGPKTGGAVGPSFVSRRRILIPAFELT